MGESHFLLIKGLVFMGTQRILFPFQGPFFGHRESPAVFSQVPRLSVWLGLISCALIPPPFPLYSRSYGRLVLFSVAKSLSFEKINGTFFSAYHVSLPLLVS